MWSLKKIFNFSSTIDILITNETNFQLEIYVQKLLIELITQKTRKRLKGKKIEIIIPENFGQTVYKYAIDEEKEYYDKYGYSTSRGNFSITLENNKPNFKLIINSSVFEDFQYFSTLTHEFTHALDFSEYINKYGNPITMDREMKKDNYYFEFFLWTEFNAKKIGLLRFQKELHNNNLELVISLSNFINEIENEVDSLPKLYHLMHFFARISVCKDKLDYWELSTFSRDYLIPKFGQDVTTIQLIMEKIVDFKGFEKEKNLLRYLLFSPKNYFY